MFFSKKITRLISKGMSNITIEKNWRSENLSKKQISPKENVKKSTNLEEQKGTSCIQENVYFDIIVLSCLSSKKACFRFLLVCFAREIKGFYQSYLGNKVDFRDIMNVCPNILAKNWNFKKLKHCFVDERALITTTLIYFCQWKTLVPFCLLNKRPEIAILTLTVKYRKIV